MYTIQFPFVARLALAVASAIAEEVENNTRWSREWLQKRDHQTRPVLLSIKEQQPEVDVKILCVFEGGTTVAVHLAELSQWEEGRWSHNAFKRYVVTGATVRYYHLNANGSRNPDEPKVEERWDAAKLGELKAARWWDHPHVLSVDKITGTVAIFVNNAAGKGFTEVDPSSNTVDFANIWEKISFQRYTEGDLERAEAEAKARLGEILTQFDQDR